jgi:hypothetical protein
MPDVAVSDDKALSRWLVRIGAALVAPRLALRASDSPAGQGRSSSDITLLLLLTVAVLRTDLFSMAGWMVGDGDYRGAFTVLMVGAREHLIMPIVLLLIGSVVLTILAGRRRAVATDFDLVCVALTPLVAVELVHALLQYTGLNVHQVSVVIGYSWSAVLMVLALHQARSRPLKTKDASPND